MRQLRQPRLAEIVAASLRDDILTGRLSEGDTLPRQEEMFARFGVSLPALREAMRILETEGLISVRRGNVGGAVVHLPSAERTARMISMVLQVRGTSLSDVSGAMVLLEPLCAGLCAARADRAEAVVPYLREALDAQIATIADIEAWTPGSRRFHEAIVAHCGNETMKVVIGSLETIWSAHEMRVWGDGTVLSRQEADADSDHATKSRHAAVKDHERILAAIEAGDESRAIAIATAHLSVTRTTFLAESSADIVQVNLLDQSEFTSR